MKELSGTARNLQIIEGEGEYRATVELVLIVTEPQWRVGSGELIRERMAESYRIGMGRHSLDSLMQTLHEISDDLLPIEDAAAILNKAKDAAGKEPKP